MRRVEQLIRQSRRETENEEFTDDVGILDEEFIEWINQAQYRIQSQIAQKSDKVFSKEAIITTVPFQESYTLPDDVLFQNSVSNLEIAPFPGNTEFYPLHQALLKERSTVVSGQPNRYIRLGGKILLNPVPDSSIYRVRVVYIPRINRLDVRRAKIDSVVTTGNNITTLVLDTTSLIDKEALEEESRFSIVDRDGNTVMRRVLYDSIDDSTGIVVVNAGFSFEDGESISAGNYLVRGGFSSNKPELPFSLERYLIQSMTFKAFKKDSSNDANPAAQELALMEQEILDSFADVDDDILRVPIISNEIVVDEEIF